MRSKIEITDDVVTRFIADFVGDYDIYTKSDSYRAMTRKGLEAALNVSFAE